jgi:hypothetical protein
VTVALLGFAARRTLILLTSSTLHMIVLVIHFKLITPLLFVGSSQGKACMARG